MEESEEAELEVSCRRWSSGLTAGPFRAGAGGRRKAAAGNRADQGGGAVMCADMDSLSTYMGLALLSFVSDHWAWLG